MRRLRLVVSLGLCGVTATYADSGLYVGVGAGLGTIISDATNGYQFGDNTTSKYGSNMAGGIFVGYDFSRYVGIQADYDYIANVSYPTLSQGGTQGTTSANQQILDLGISGHLPFGLFANPLSGLSIFARLALGYSTSSFNGGSLTTNNGNIQQLPPFSNSLVPVIAAGVEYGWDNIGVRGEYTYIGNTAVFASNQQLMNVSNSLWLLSVLYHF